ncbi:hypothetical protein ACPEEZ_09260 [Frigoribacterium sp. 2-23]|uniref:hypothetical protein n=1 Tax=Frigoribacterium sp. 2-23 TaxID=3415006 RepID=UPI003C6F0601
MRRPRATQDEREAVTRAADEGLLIIDSALVVAVANRIILRALGDAEAFDQAVAEEAVADELRRLADEQAEQARRMARLRRRTHRSYGQSRHQFDYRTDDIGALTLREKTAASLARTLRQRQHDAAFRTRVVDAARARAWDDVGSTVVDRIGYAARPTADYDEGREERLRALREIDLADLLGAAPEHDADADSPRD